MNCVVIVLKDIQNTVIGVALKNSRSDFKEKLFFRHDLIKNY